MIFCLIKESLQAFRHIVDQSLGGFPSEAGIGYGFAVAVFADLLAALLNVAFNHNALDHIADLLGVTAAVKNLFYDAHLFGVLFAGVGVVAVYDAGRVL